MAIGNRQTMEQRNEERRALNRAPGQHANYYLQERTPTGYKSVEDPYYSSLEYVNSPNSRYAKPTEAESLMWNSSKPGSAFYSPTGSDWQTLNEGMLSDPKIAQMVMKGGSGGAFSGWQSKIPQGVKQGIEGSSHSLGADILNKMWR